MSSGAGHDSTYSRLLAKTFFTGVACVILVSLCYFWVDRSVALFVHEQDFARHEWLKWLTYPPPILQAWTPAILAALMIRRAWGPFLRWERALLAACVSIVLADQFKDSMAYLAGRYWPETWVDNNPSLIRDNTYGFHPFHSGRWYGSFPSGHTARTLSLAAVVWLAYPKLRAFCGLAGIAIVIGLVGMNYHFVSDVIAGAFVGSLVGVYAWTLVASDRN